ncbi:MAG: hypothetical protein PHY57_14730 [Ignavibacterium sp.]|nr:hypothetical protein [Melioribacteraceae bacterium]MDD3558632.1 hypothetical protein [Melioribacteraceae bacterium]MDD5609769.1 hypothetical protein [Ignavibacterium sp.]
MYVVKYSGPFGFIKPWTAVRDTETFSQQFLTPSIVEGIEKKLFPELLNESGIKKIVRHRLTYLGFSHQQEQTQPRGIKQKTQKIDDSKQLIEFSRSKSILTRVVLVEPTLYLGFNERVFAERALNQHICLCRNEDVLLPDNFIHDEMVIEISEENFDDPYGEFNGFELMFEENEKSFIVGYNRFMEKEIMHGWLKIIGTNPLKQTQS